MLSPRGKLTESQIAAILRSAKLGRTLQQEHPEIEQLYRNGHSLKEISEQLNLEENYGLKSSSSISATRFALAGVQKRYFENMPQYEGLIEYDEFQKIARLHLEESAKNIPQEARERALINSLDALLERREEIGRIGGNVTRDKKKGVHAMSSHELSSAGKKAARSRGQIPYSLEEDLSIYEMKESSDFQYSAEDKHRGQPNWSTIASQLNQLYHNSQDIRNGYKVSQRFKYLERKKRTSKDK